MALPVACSLSDAQFRARRAGVVAEARAGVRETRRVRGGSAFRFDGDARSIETAAKLMVLERECCRFLRMRITADADGGAVWLEMTGPRGTAHFVQVELGLAA